MNALNLISFYTAGMEGDRELPERCWGDVLCIEGYPARPLPAAGSRALEFNLLLRGRVRYLLGTERRDLEPGDLLWLWPGTECVIVDRSADVRCWVLVASPELVRRLAAGERYRALAGGATAPISCRRLSERHTRSLAGLLEELSGKSDDPEHFNAGLSFVLTSAWRAHVAANDVPAGTSVHPAVERAAKLIHDETEPLRGAKLARAAGLSFSRLSQLFHEQTGKTLAAFRNEQRLRRFFERYGEGRTSSLNEAALAAGFGSYPQFYRVFRRGRAESPGDYRRALTWSRSAR